MVDMKEEKSEARQRIAFEVRLKLNATATILQWAIKTKD